MIASTKPKVNKYQGDVAPAGTDDLDQLLKDFGFYESAFLPGQFEATKKALRKLIDSRVSPDVAVRNAVSLCAPSVMKKRFKADTLGQSATGARIGGNYDAIDHQNGFFSIMNIEIFAEVPPGAKRNKERIGEDWMDKAIERNRLRRKEGFLPPVHIWHSDETAVKPTYAGKFVLTHRGTITYEGREIPALFANITDIPADVFKRIQQGTLPYRSVEVHDWDNPEIDSLAIMDTDVPFFRMPMTTIGEVRKQRGPLPIGFKNVMSTPVQYLQHLFTQGAEGRTLGARICFRFEDRKGGANMATEISTVKKGNTSKGLAKIPAGSPSSKSTDGLTGQESGSGGEMGPTSGTATENQDSLTGLDDGGDDAGDATDGSLDDGGDMDDATIAGSKRQPGGASPKMDDGIGAVKSNTAKGGQDNEQVKLDDAGGAAAGGDPMSQLAAILQQALQLCQASAQPAAQPPAAAPQNTAPVGTMRASSIEKILLKAVMPLQLKIKNLEAVQLRSQHRAKISGLVAKAKRDLEGWPIDDEIEASLLKAAEGGYIDEVVALVQKTQPAEPFENAAQFEAALADMPGGAEVAKFMADNPGPKAQEWVRNQTREHAAHVARFGSDITLEQWLKTNANYEKTATPSARPSPNTMRALMGN